MPKGERRGMCWLWFWWTMVAVLLACAWMTLSDGQWFIALVLTWSALILTDPDEVFRA